MDSREPDGEPITDALDIDLIIKVLSNTLFSPFFTALIPTFYLFQGASLSSPIILSSSLYFLAVSSFWTLKWCSKVYENPGLWRGERLDWSEQVVVVTGGASGVGELLANTLAVKNVTVVVLDVKPIQTDSYNVHYYQCDISNWEEVDNVAKKIIDEVGQPTILVNNAGVVQGKPILDLTPRDIQQTFGVNTLSHFWTLKAFLPGMIQAGSGHIVTTASVLGLAGCASMTDYCASKAALIRLHESLRFELDHTYLRPHIRTTLLLPGHILTPLFSHASFRNTFLTPSVAPVVIVKKVIEALDKGCGGRIRVPFYVNLVEMLGIVPSFVKGFCHWVTGADYVMRGFVKVTGRREEEGPLPEDSKKRI